MSREDDAGAFIEVMKGAAGVELDRDLALRLGIDPSAVAAWRRRKKVPDKYRVRLARMVDEDAAEEPDAPSYTMLLNGYLFALVGLAARRLSENVHVLKDDEYKDIWYGFRLHKLYYAARRQLHNVEARDKDKLRKVFEQLRARIDSDDLYLWIETLPEPS